MPRKRSEGSPQGSLTGTFRYDTYSYTHTHPI